MPNEEKTPLNKLVRKAVTRKVLIGVGVTAVVVGLTVVLTRKIDNSAVAGYVEGLEEGVAIANQNA